MRLYEYAAFVDADDIEDAIVVIPVTSVLARDDTHAQSLIEQAIPEDYARNGNRDRLTIKVRRFDENFVWVPPEASMV